MSPASLQAPVLGTREAANQRSLCQRTQPQNRLLTGLHGHRNWLIALLIYRHTRRLQHYLGHARITNTVRYTAMSPEPFKVIW